MPYPNSYTRMFMINGTTFRHYYARDSHGTELNSYSVNAKMVEYPEFMDKVQKAVGDSEFYITQACGLSKLQTPDWSKR